MIKLSGILLLIFCSSFYTGAKAQDATTLVKQVKEKLDKVNDYVASGEMKTSISFMKVPVAEVKVYFKKPGKIKIRNEKGVSLVPKGSVSISLGSLLGGQFTAI